MGFTQTDKDLVQKLECKKNRLLLTGVGKALTNGQIIDRDTDTYIFNKIYESGASIAAKGSHTNEEFVVDTERDRTGDPTLWVAPGGDDSNAGTRANPLQTLGKAATVAGEHASGAEKTIKVLPGDYAENLTVSTDNVEIIGHGPDDSIMDDLTVDSGAEVTVKDMEAANVTINDADTTVWFENLEVGTDLTISNTSGISMRGDSLVVNGTVTDAGGKLSRFDG
jgi:pectin methylesterase-like acyl-CoA thioesterase